MPTIHTIDPDNIDPEIMAMAASYIREGKLVAFPTETVYGIGANALDADAVARIYAAKRRPASDPLIVHISATSQLDDVVDSIPPLALALAETFWPGPLTMILKKSPRVPANVTSGLDSVAVRFPSHPVAQALIRQAGVPIAAPSANLFSRPSATSGKHVSEDFDQELDMVLDGGESTIGVESTVIDLTGDTPTILRPGGLSAEDLQAMIPELQIKTGYLSEEVAATSPGMLLKHYSPNAQVLLFSGHNESRILQAMISEAEKLESSGKKVGVLATSNQADEITTPNRVVFLLGQSGDLESISQSLYKGLRMLDENGVDVILASTPSPEGLGLAIRDRLYRSAEGHIIQVA